MRTANTLSEEQKLRQAFQRILGSDTQRSHFAKYLAARSLGKLELVDLQDIEYIQADGPCSLIVTQSGEKKTHDKMLKDIAQIVPPYFERVHKSYIANLRAIKILQSGPNHKNLLTFPSGRSIPLSRSKSKELKSQFGS